MIEENKRDISKLLNIPAHNRGVSQTEYLISLTKNVAFFKKLTQEYNSPEIHMVCCGVMSLEEYESGNIIIEFGEAAKKFYIILTGSVSVMVPMKQKIKLTLQQYKKYENLSKLDSSSSSLTEEINAARREARATVINVKDILNKLKDDEVFSYLKRQHSNSIMDIEEKNIIKLFKKNLKKEKREILNIVKEANQDFIEVELNKMEEVSTMKEGDSFGELALISDRPRAATVVARERTVLLVLSKDQFKEILGSIAEKRVLSKVKLLKCFSYFSSWSKNALSKLAYFFISQQFTHKQSLFKQGQTVNGIYFVVQGEFILTKRIEANIDRSQRVTYTETEKIERKVKPGKVFKEVKIVIKGKNESIGGFDIFTNRPNRDYSCYCMSSTAEVYFVNKIQFLSKFPNLDTIKAMLQEENLRLEKRLKDILEFEHSPILKELKIETPFVRKTISKSSRTIFPRIEGKGSLELQRTSEHEKVPAASSKSPFRRLTSQEVSEAINGRTQRVISRTQEDHKVFSHKRTPPLSFLGKYREIFNK